MTSSTIMSNKQFIIGNNIALINHSIRIATDLAPSNKKNVPLSNLCKAVFEFYFVFEMILKIMLYIRDISFDKKHDLMYLYKLLPEKDRKELCSLWESNKTDHRSQRVIGMSTRQPSCKHPTIEDLKQFGSGPITFVDFLSHYNENKSYLERYYFFEEDAFKQPKIYTLFSKKSFIKIVDYIGKLNRVSGKVPRRFK